MTKFIGDMGEFVLTLSGWTFIGTAVLFLFLLLANVLRAVTNFNIPFYLTTEAAKGLGVIAILAAVFVFTGMKMLHYAGTRENHDRT